MKQIYTITVITAILASITSINAYEYSFFNNTKTPLGIAIQYMGNDGIEPLYKQLVKPASTVIFSPGKTTMPFSSYKIEIPALKWGFCLDNIFYTENPTPISRTTKQKPIPFQNAIWKKAPIAWVKEKSIHTKSKKKLSQKYRPLEHELPLSEKSLCRDRHFDITRNEHGQIIINSSLNE